MFFETWAIFALLAAATYACSQIIDKFTLDKIFDNTNDWVIGICVTSILPVLGLLAVFGLPETVTPLHALMSFASGGVLFLCFYFYAKSLKKSDVDVVCALQQFDPIYAVLIGVLFLNDSLSLTNIFGILLIVMMAFAISIPLRQLLKGKKTKVSLRRSPFFYIQISCLIFVGSSAIIDHLLVEYAVLDVMFYYFLGTFIAGLAYWALNAKESGFIATLKKHKTSAVISLIAIQATNALALYFVFKAYEIGSFSMVTALMATEPFIITGIIYLFNKIRPGVLLQHFKKEDLYVKMPAYLGIFMGVHLMLL